MNQHKKAEDNKNKNISRPDLSGARIILAVLVAVGLSGCVSNQPMKIALTEMGTTSDSEYGAYSLRMIRAVNVTGLGAEEVVGTMTTDIDKWSYLEQFVRFSPKRHDLPDSMSPRITSGASKIVERRFCKSILKGEKHQCVEVDKKIIDACDKTPTGPGCKDIVTISDLTVIRDTLQRYQVEIAEAAHLELKNEVLSAAQGTFVSDPAKKDEILKSLQLLYPEDNFKDVTAFEAVQKNVASSQNINTITKQFDNIKLILSKPGIIITNWERETAFSGSATVADAQGAVSSTRKVSGFLILGEPRITSLQLGDDLLVRQEENNDKPYGADLLFKSQRNYITHYQLRAKYVVFTESYQSAFNASLQADISAIAQKIIPLISSKLSLEDKLKDIQAKVNASYAAVTAASESGVLDASNGYVQMHTFSFERKRIADLVAAEMERSKDTLPIISIRANLDDFIKKSAFQPGNNK